MKRRLQNLDILQNIFHSSVEGILVINNNGNILMANPACEQLFGYDPEKLIDKAIHLILPQIKDAQKNDIDNPIKYINQLGVKKNGFKFHLDISLTPTTINEEKATIIFLRDAHKRNKNIEISQQIHTKLLESNRKLSTLVDNLQGIVYRCQNDRDWSMEYISDGCKIITGYSPEEFLKGKIHFSQIILDQDKESVWNNTQKSLNKKKPFQQIFRIKDKKGNIKYISEQGQGIFNDNGKPEALEGFITDITAQKETELQLSNSKTKIKALLDVIPDMMFIQDLNGNYLDYYAGNYKASFLPSKKIIGKNMKDILPANIYKKINVLHNEVISSGKIQVTEYSYRGKKGIEHYEARVVHMNDHKLLTMVRDITDKKNANALLSIRNNALASASNGIVIADAQQPNKPILYCNKAFEKITGYSKKEVLGKNCNFLQNDDRNQKEVDIMRNAISNGEACNVVLRNYRKDGTMFWNEVAITPIFDEDHRLTHFIGVQNDVSNRIKEEHLKDQKRKILELIAHGKPLKTIVNKIIETVQNHLKNSIASIFLLDENTTEYKLIAPNLPETFLDYVKTTTIGKKIGACGSSVFSKKEVIVPNIGTNSLCDDYKHMALQNGLKSCWAFPIFSSNKQVLGTFTIYSNVIGKPLKKDQKFILDMTDLASIAIEKHLNIIALKESKKALEAYTQKLEEKVQERTEEVMTTVQKLVESNLELEGQVLITKKAKKEAMVSKYLNNIIANNFPNGFITVINNSFKIQFAKGEALKKLGLQKLALEGMTIDDIPLFSKERKTKIKYNIRQTLNGKHLSFEVAYNDRFFSVNTAPLYDEQNKIYSAVMVYTDITQQKDIEHNIKEALKKERELNDLKSRFISMASHEFRTPLSAILTSAVLIGKQNEPGKELKREKYVSQIEKNVNNLIVILNEFLSLSRLEEGKIMVNKETLDLINLSKTIVNEYNVNLKKGQSINLISSSKKLLIHTDPKLLRHIFFNLLSNASKYAPEQTLIEFKISENKQNINIDITDEGMGIPENEQKRVFDRFFRAKNAINIEGTGLGLNIVKNYVELIGGSIGFNSILGEGSTFRVEFPIEIKR